MMTERTFEVARAAVEDIKKRLESYAKYENYSDWVCTISDLSKLKNFIDLAEKELKK